MDTVILEGISCGISIRPTLREFMSLFLQNFHVLLWSCMEDALIHNVLQRLFLENIVRRLAFVWGISKCKNTNGFIGRDVSFLKKKEILFRHHKNLYVCERAISCLSMISLTNTSRTRCWSVCYFPHTWPGPRVIYNITIVCYLYIEKLIITPNVLLYSRNRIIDRQLPIPNYHEWFGLFVPLVTSDRLPNSTKIWNSLSLSLFSCLIFLFSFLL
jgi:hypothetical protein